MDTLFFAVFMAVVVDCGVCARYGCVVWLFSLFYYVVNPLLEYGVMTGLSSDIRHLLWLGLGLLL